MSLATKVKNRAISSFELFAIILSGVIGAISTIVLVEGFELISEVVWGDWFGVNPEAPTCSFAAPLMVVAAGLAIGLIIKKLGRPMKGLNEIVAEISNRGYIRWRDAPRTLLIALLSISSGASLGPEAPSTVASAGFASYFGEKTKRSLRLRKMMGMSSLVGMIAGFFILIVYSDGGFDLPAVTGGLLDLPAAFLIGMVGAAIGKISGLLMYAIDPAISRLDKKPLHRALTGSLIVGFIMYLVPLTMFSGQHVLGELSIRAQSLSVVALLALALAKLFSTQVLLRVGFFGGPIFPALFAGVAVGLAGSYILGGAATVAIAASLAGLLTIMTGKPLIAGLIAIAFTSTSAIPAAVLGVAGAMVLQHIADKLNVKMLKI